jgi:hypothetical protein
MIVAVAGLTITILAEVGLFETAKRWQADRWSPRVAARTDLRVDPWGSGLRVSWTPGKAPIRSARAGALLIEDGPLPAEYVNLDAVQLASGEFFYSPKSGVVRFRLDVSRPAAGTAGSIIAVLGDRQALAALH